MLPLHFPSENTPNKFGMWLHILPPNSAFLHNMQCYNNLSPPNAVQVRTCKPIWPCSIIYHLSVSHFLFNIGIPKIHAQLRKHNMKCFFFCGTSLLKLADTHLALFYMHLFNSLESSVVGETYRQRNLPLFCRKSNFFGTIIYSTFMYFERTLLD